MASRRQFIVSATTLACGSLATGGCASGTAGDRYDTAVLETWHHSDGPIAEPALLQRELVRYATLAPSSHNTQCWALQLQDRAIVLASDRSRRRPVVGPDHQHTCVSLGCASVKLAQAARTNGLRADVRFGASGPGTVARGWMRRFSTDGGRPDRHSHVEVRERALRQPAPQLRRHSGVRLRVSRQGVLG
jgi:hypothetical protein